MTFKPSLLAFITGESLGDGVQQVAPDWQNKVYVVSNDNIGGNPGIFRFDFNSGAAEQHALLTSLATLAQAPPFALDSFGALYMSATGASNYDGYLQANAADLSFIAQFGTSNASSNLPDGVPYASALTAVRTGGLSFLFGASGVPFAPVLWVLIAGPGIFGFGGYLFTLAGFSYGDLSAVSCAGPQGPSTAALFTVAGPRISVGSDPKLVLYRSVCGSGVALYDVGTWPTQTTNVLTTTIGTILPTDIDATWTQIFHSGLVYDATDGDILIQVSTEAGPAQTAYIAKVSAADAHVLWTVPVDYVNSSTIAMSAGRIRHGRYCHITTDIHGNTVTVIDTTNGSFTTFTEGLAGLTTDSQCFDDTTGAILAVTSFLEEAGSPTPLGSTPSSFSTQWSLLYVIEGFVEPVAPLSKTGYTRIWGNV